MNNTSTGALKWGGLETRAPPFLNLYCHTIALKCIPEKKTSYTRLHESVCPGRMCAQRAGGGLTAAVANSAAFECIQYSWVDGCKPSAIMPSLLPARRQTVRGSALAVVAMHRSRRHATVF